MPTARGDDRGLPRRGLRRRPAERQLALLRAHPDLAGRAAIAGDLAAESQREQAGAGLDRLTPEEFARFTALNARYRETLRLPVHLRGARAPPSTRSSKASTSGSENDPETEFATALGQVARIIRFRLEDRVAP